MTLMLAIIWLWKRKRHHDEPHQHGAGAGARRATLMSAQRALHPVETHVSSCGRWARRFLGSVFIGKQPLVQHLLQPALSDVRVERRDWLKVNAACVAFCLLAGIANLLVAYRASEATWVNVKVYGLTGAMFLFLMAQIWWLYSMNRGDPDK